MRKGTGSTEEDSNLTWKTPVSASSTPALAASMAVMGAGLIENTVFRRAPSLAM